jgi:antitoxin CcdA
MQDMDTRIDVDAGGKTRIEVTIDAELAAEAKAAGIDPSDALERALKQETKEARWSRWREENRAAIEASNDELERNGLWCDAYRTW